MPQHEQHGCTVLFTRHQSTKVCQAFSKFWLVFWISAFRSMLRRWTSRNKTLIPKFPDIISFVITPESFGEFWRKSVQSIKSFGLYSFQNQMRGLAHKGSQTTRVTPGHYLPSWNLKTMVQWDLLASMTIYKDFPGNVTHRRHLFFFFFFFI